MTINTGNKIKDKEIAIFEIYVIKTILYKMVKQIHISFSDLIQKQKSVNYIRYHKPNCNIGDIF